MTERHTPAFIPGIFLLGVAMNVDRGRAIRKLREPPYMLATAWFPDRRI